MENKRKRKEKKETRTQPEASLYSLSHTIIYIVLDDTTVRISKNSTHKTFPQRNRTQCQRKNTMKVKALMAQKFQADRKA